MRGSVQLIPRWQAPTRGSHAKRRNDLRFIALRLAYDGRGNFVVGSPEVLPQAVTALGGFEHGLYAERWAPFVKELAVMVMRARDGCVASYPVVETVHKDNICWVTEAPADVPPALAAKVSTTSGGVAHIDVKLAES